MPSGKPLSIEEGSVGDSCAVWAALASQEIPDHVLDPPGTTEDHIRRQRFQTG